MLKLVPAVEGGLEVPSKPYGPAPAPCCVLILLSNISASSVFFGYPSGLLFSYDLLYAGTEV